MNLPLVLLTEPSDLPHLVVDGVADAPGLNLSHWPGNRTPREFRHDLSTGCALKFAALPASERQRWAAGAVAIANNHFDTDGACAMFAVRHPELALPRAERLLATAAAGDFFQVPDERAFALDATINGLVDPRRSPLAAEFPAGSKERYEFVLHFLMERLPALLDGDLEPFAELWRPELERLRADRRTLGDGTREDDAELDLTLWTSRVDGSTFDPGRHAFFGDSRADRVALVGPSAHGTTYRFVLSTLSWFDLESAARLPRPDLDALATRLNGLEGTAPDDPAAWRFQGLRNASPELWFGTADLESFSEHNSALVPSGIEPARWRTELTRALRPG